MFDAHRLLLFLAAALLLAVTPGPGIFYVLARSLAGGKREGILSSLGTFVGGLFQRGLVVGGRSLDHDIVDAFPASQEGRAAA